MNKRLLIILMAALAISIGIFSGTILKNQEIKKAQQSINQQVVLQAQKAAEEKAKLEEQKKIEEEKKKEELKKQEEQKTLPGKQMPEDPVKLKQAINGQGTSNKIPVLMYHSIKYEKGNELRIPKEKFKEQMEYLKNEGFHPLSLNELYSHMLYGTKLPEKPIVITLDDGYEDNYTNAYPVLKELGFKAVVFMITEKIDNKTDYLTSEQIKEMDKNGISIEGHTVTHPELDKLTYEEQVKELKDSKDALEKLLGRDINYLAYPYGKYNKDTLKAAEEIGYKMSFSTEGGLAHKSNGIYKLHRIYISDKHDMQQFKQRVNMK